MQDKKLDPLALGLTKTPMFMGVSLKLFFANLVFCLMLCLNLKTLFGLLLFIILHLIAVLKSIKEPNFLSLYFNAFIKTPPNRNYMFWGKVNSYEPW